MVKELNDRDEKCKSFSRRRRLHEEKDIDSIHNEHFNKKIERAFGKYTPDIKNNLERGTALPRLRKVLEDYRVFYLTIFFSEY